MLIAVLFEIVLKLETIQMLISGRIEREMVVYSHSAIPHSNEKNKP